MDDKPVIRIFANLEAARARHVEKEKDIVYGKVQKWCDVEADEVDLGKELCEDGSSLRWEQWGDIVVATQRHWCSFDCNLPLRSLGRPAPVLSVAESGYSSPRSSWRIDKWYFTPMGQKRTSLLCPGSFTTMLCTRRSGSWSMASRHGCGLTTRSFARTPCRMARRFASKRALTWLTDFGDMSVLTWSTLPVVWVPAHWGVRSTRPIGRIGIRARIFGAPQRRCCRTCPEREHAGEKGCIMLLQCCCKVHIEHHTADGSCTYVADLPVIHVQTKRRSWRLLLQCVNSSDSMQPTTFVQYCSVCFLQIKLSTCLVPLMLYSASMPTLLIQCGPWPLCTPAAVTFYKTNFQFAQFLPWFTCAPLLYADWWTTFGSHILICRFRSFIP